MKNEAWRRLPSSYPVRGELMPRLTDVDLWQHLNNTALMSLHGENCQRWLRSSFGHEVWRQASPAIVTLGLETDFLAEAHYPEPLATGCRLLAVEEGAFTLGSALFQHGHCVGLQRATLAVWVDGRPVPLPAAVADALHAAAAQQPALPAGAAEASRTAVAGAVPVLADFSWQIPLAARFADSDARGLTSDTSLGRYAEQARVQFLTQVFGPERRAAPTGFIVGHVALRWRRRDSPPAQWQAGCGVIRLGERSMAVRSGLFDGDQCHAVCDTVMVSIDRASRRSTELPEASRSLLERHRLRDGQGLAV